MHEWTDGTNENKQADKYAKQMGKIVRSHRCMNAESIEKRIANSRDVLKWICTAELQFMCVRVFSHQLCMFDEMQMHWNDGAWSIWHALIYVFSLIVLLLLSERYSYSLAAFFSQFSSAIIVGKANVNMCTNTRACINNKTCKIITYDRWNGKVRDSG